MTGDLFGYERKQEPAPAQSVDTVTRRLAIHGDVGAAVRVSEHGEEHGSVLLPRREITVQPTGERTNHPGRPKLAIANVTMPAWLAKDRGL